MKSMEKAYEILKKNNMLDKKLMTYCTYEEAINMREEERPIRRVENDLVFYTAYFSSIEDVKNFNTKKHKKIQNKKYKIIKHKNLDNGIVIEVPKYVIKNYFSS